MSEENIQKTGTKVDLKALRQERLEWVQKANQKLKSQNKEIALLKKALADGSRTVPQLTVETNLPSEKVMYYMASLLKYGQIKEVERQGLYYGYALTDAKESAMESKEE